MLVAPNARAFDGIEDMVETVEENFVRRSSGQGSDF
jgi:hypothetical protein